MNDVPVADQPIAELEARVSRNERRVLVRTVALTLVPIVAAAALLWITIAKVQHAQNELAQTRVELARTQRELDEAQQQAATLRAQNARTRRQAANLKKRVNELRVQLQDAARFERHVHQFDFTDVKIAATRNARLSHVFLNIAESQQMGVGWGLDNTLQTGFTSPGFAAYVLDRLPSNRGDPLQTLRSLRHRAGEPQPGDVILYEGGFAMFYLRDAEGHPFVVGMTPVGIVSLERNFGPRELEILDTGLDYCDPLRGSC